MKDARRMKVYHWGEPSTAAGIEEVSAEEFEQMEQLGEGDMAGMQIAPEDVGKKMYAYPDDIDRDADGTAVKYSYVEV